MIKNCFMSEQPDFKKEVLYKKEKLATIKALTTRDWADISRATIINQKLDDNGELDVTENGFLTVLYMVWKSLDTWVFDKPITLDNVNDLSPKLLAHLYKEVSEHEDEFKKNFEDISKN